MKKTPILVILVIVVSLSLFVNWSVEEPYDSLREPDESQADFLTKGIQERRGQLVRRMSNQNCLVWIRRRRRCFFGKRGYGTSEVMYSPLVVY